MIFIPLRVFLGYYLCVICFRFTNSLGRYYLSLKSPWHTINLHSMICKMAAVLLEWSCCSVLPYILPELKLVLLLLIFRGEFVGGFPGGYTNTRDLSWTESRFHWISIDGCNAENFSSWQRGSWNLHSFTTTWRVHDNCKLENGRKTFWDGYRVLFRGQKLGQGDFSVLDGFYTT